ncbi:MAG: hydroxymethylbilane synthase [Pseudomonadota bacterium]
MTKRILKIGTRGSPLALVQANMVKQALEEAHKELEVQIVPIKSKADWQKGQEEKALDEAGGGKGQFASEIEAQILSGDIDCGVHSLKDMDSFLAKGLTIKHVLPRADARDVFISSQYKSIEELPAGATVGTCSQRRAALVLSINPNVEILPFRGNVDTRLEKIRAGQVDATLLAKAGLDRLGLAPQEATILETEKFMPACGQGIVCLEVCEDDLETHTLLAPIHCEETGYAMMAERRVLQMLNGSCHTPIGAYASIRKGEMTLKALVASNDGQNLYREEKTIEVRSNEQALECGEAVGQALREIVPPDLLK